jgi:thiol-disulfide isomerase/thioredoxin
MKKSNQKFIAALTGVILLIALSACGSEDQAKSTPQDQSVAASNLLNITGQSVEGENFSFSSLSSKPTVVWFWTPWCAICVGEGPTINEAFAKYGDSVNFVGVGAQGTTGEMKEFVEITQTSKIIQINDADSSIWAHFEIPLQPSLIFIGTDGYIDRKIGPTNEADFQKRLNLLLESSA